MCVCSCFIPYWRHVMMHVWRAQNNFEELILPNLADTGSFLFLPWCIVSASWSVNFGAVSLFPSPISSWCGDYTYVPLCLAFCMGSGDQMRLSSLHGMCFHPPSHALHPEGAVISFSITVLLCFVLCCFVTRSCTARWATSRWRLWMTSNTSASWFLGYWTWVLRYTRLAFYLLSYIASTTVLTVKHTDQQCWVHSWCSITNFHNTWESCKNWNTVHRTFLHSLSLHLGHHYSAFCIFEFDFSRCHL